MQKGLLHAERPLHWEIDLTNELPISRLYSPLIS
jgi:hypothetical protein